MRRLSTLRADQRSPDSGFGTHVPPFAVGEVVQYIDDRPHAAARPLGPATFTYVVCDAQQLFSGSAQSFERRLDFMVRHGLLVPVEKRGRVAVHQWLPHGHPFEDANTCSLLGGFR